MILLIDEPMIQLRNWPSTIYCFVLLNFTVLSSPYQIHRIKYSLLCVFLTLIFSQCCCEWDWDPESGYRFSTHIRRQIPMLLLCNKWKFWWFFSQCIWKTSQYLFKCTITLLIQKAFFNFFSSWLCPRFKIQNDFVLVFHWTLEQSSVCLGNIILIIKHSVSMNFN